MSNRQEAITAISKLHAAIAEETTIQLTDFFGDEKTNIVNRMVAEKPPRKALTNDNCSATAIIKLGLASLIFLFRFRVRVSRPYQQSHFSLAMLSITFLATEESTFSYVSRKNLLVILYRVQ